MSGLDVLAVMDRAFCYAQNNCVYDDVRELDAARAAVAELIEAAEQAHAFLCEKAPSTATEYRVRTALSRVRGAE